MNLARKMIFLSMGCFTCIGAKAQIDCTTSTKLTCLIPFAANGTHQNGAAGATATVDASIFNGAIGSQLSQLPLAGSAPGVTILTIKGNPEPYNNLGPVLIDRPDSIGQGKFVLGFSAQEFTFNRLDSYRIGAIPLVYYVSQSQNYFAQTVNASVKYNQYVILATYGLPMKTDISVIVPYTRISLRGAALNPVTYSASTFIEGTAPTPGTSGSTPGSAKGLGDIILNVKHVLWSGGEPGRASVAAGAALRLPTGDPLNYLGSGAYGVNLYGLAAYKAKFSPHIKIGYQWNTNSVLSFNYAAYTAGGNGNQRLPGGLQSAVGVDYGPARWITLSADILTNEFQNSPSISVVPFSSTANSATLFGTIPNPATPPALGNATCNSNLTGATSAALVGNLCTATSVDKSYTAVNFSGGFKLKPLKHQNLILYGNVLIQATDVGLRSEASPSVGISYNFSSNKWPHWLYR